MQWRMGCSLYIYIYTRTFYHRIIYSMRFLLRGYDYIRECKFEKFKPSPLKWMDLGTYFSRKIDYNNSPYPSGKYEHLRVITSHINVYRPQGRIAARTCVIRTNYARRDTIGTGYRIEVYASDSYTCRVVIIERVVVCLV